MKHNRFGSFVLSATIDIAAPLLAVVCFPCSNPWAFGEIAMSTKSCLRPALLCGVPAINLWVTGATKKSPKMECAKIEPELGGCVAHAALAYQQAACDSPTVAAFVAKDELRSLMATLLRAQFQNCQLIPTVAATRLSMIVPSDLAGRHTIYTTHPRIGVAATMLHLTPLLRQHDWVLVAPLGAAEISLAEQVLAEFEKTPAKRAYLMLSASQIAVPSRALELIRRAAWIQLNVEEIEALTGRTGIVEGVYALRTQGVRGGLIVTCGEEGAYVHDTDWHYQPAFVPPRPVKTDYGLGHCFAGTMLAALSQEFDLSTALRLSTAAAAMLAAGMPRVGGWAELQRFARNAPTRAHHCQTASAGRKPLRTWRVSPFAAGAIAATLVAAVVSWLWLVV